MIPLPDLDHAGPEMLIEELLALNPSHSCPRWAVLGPSYSGKTQFLQRFIEECKRDNHARCPIPIYLDLKKLSLDREEQMYQSVFRALDLACRGLSFQVSGEGPPDGSGRFEHFIQDLLRKADSRVALVVDHLDSAPHYFARSLIRRFRLMVDQEIPHPEYRKLCVLLAGRTSLFDLRQTGDSAFIASNLIFPRQDAASLSRHLSAGSAPSQAILVKLEKETGQEELFVDLLFAEIGKLRGLSARNIDAAVERLLANPERHDVFHQIALEIASHRDLRALVQDLLSSEERQIMRRDSSPDVDRFCLSGVVVLHKEHTYSCYRFRNGIVERFARKLLSETPKRTPYFPPSAKLAAVRDACNSSRDIYAAMNYLLSAWSDSIFRIPLPDSIHLHVHYFNSDLERWLNLANGPLDPSRTKKLPASVISAVSLSNEGTERHASFGFDEEKVSYSIPYARVEARLELVISFHRNLVSNLSESALSHWLHLLDDCWPYVAASALAELGSEFAAQVKATGGTARRARPADSDTRIHWMASEGIIVDAPDECTMYQVERTPQQIEKTIDDINQRCLRMVEQDGSTEEFGTRLRGVADQLQNFFENCPGFAQRLEIANGNFTFISDEMGLKIPIELLPVLGSHLGIESRIVRRLRNIVPHVEPKTFADGIEDLVATGEPLKVLLAGVDPRNSLENLDEEIRRLKELIEIGCQAINLRCQISVMESINATQAALAKRLDDKALGTFHIFHFCGHGTRGQAPDDSSLVLFGSRGEDDPVPCEKLKLMLQDRVQWMTYLSCCYGAATRGSTGIEQQYMGTIHAVVSAGIPTVVGFRWAVTDVGAYALARSFYANLFSAESGFSPSRALWMARRSIAGDKDKRDAWASSLMVCQFG
jgi:hypothetical protein